MLDSGPVGEEWIVLWFGTMSLLRTVGEVLENVERHHNGLGPSHHSWRKRIYESKRELSTGWRKPYVYHEFICRDANALLHEFKLVAAQSTTFHVHPGNFSFSGGTPAPIVFHPPAVRTITYEMTSGPFKGEDPRRVVEQAIAWWNDQIEAIEDAP